MNIKKIFEEFERQFPQEDTRMLRGKELDAEFTNDREHAIIRNKLRFEIKSFLRQALTRVVESVPTPTKSVKGCYVLLRADDDYIKEFYQWKKKMLEGLKVNKLEVGK